MKTVGYYAICSQNKSSGVYRKIQGFVSVANKLKYAATYTLIDSGRGSHFKLAKRVGCATEDLIVVRGNSYGFFLLMFGLVLARARGKQVVLDVATPMGAVFHEIWGSVSTFPVKFFKTIGWILSGPWSFLAANKIVQYAPENKWFSFGSKSKTVLIGNGVDVSSIPMRRNSPTWPGKELKLIGVAQLSSWHGYDLIIKAISEFNKIANKKFDINFTIVGAGDELNTLKQLTKNLSLCDCVRFTGNLQGDELYKEYDGAHIAISSMGLHRIGLNFASVLKAREYCAIGIPFLAAGVDPDFLLDADFRYAVNLSEDFAPIVDFFRRFELVDKFQKPGVIREFAEQNLDLQIKIKSFLEI